MKNITKKPAISAIYMYTRAREYHSYLLVICRLFAGYTSRKAPANTPKQSTTNRTKSHPRARIFRTQNFFHTENQ